ncbi:hypothetical protein ALC53_05055 [Atta colombica]|uniref:Uncharacterized protein n=1 Tax=Atta colombica TaxID=520822 RepID=A0A151I499_9HYME|nr:hypothetical protein ALC53_05055 [Atta colombica]
MAHERSVRIVGRRFVMKEVVLRKGVILSHFYMPWNILTKSKKSFAFWFLSPWIAMRRRNNPTAKRLIIMAIIVDNERLQLRNELGIQIVPLYELKPRDVEENRRIYNLKRRELTKAKMKNLIAIKRVQMGPVKKLCAKYLGPYKIIKIKLNNSYDVKHAQRKFYENKYMC